MAKLCDNKLNKNSRFRPGSELATRKIYTIDRFLFQTLPFQKFQGNSSVMYYCLGNPAETQTDQQIDA